VGLVAPRYRPPRIPWARVAGGALAEGSACLGVTASGELRVVAQNDATRRELLARADDLVSAYNLHARGLSLRPARVVVAWVGEVRHGHADGPGASLPAPGRTGVDPTLLAESREEVDARWPGLPEATRAALAKLRAGARARSLRQDGGRAGDVAPGPPILDGDEPA